MNCRNYFYRPVRDHDWHVTEREIVTRHLEDALQIAFRMEAEKVAAEQIKNEQKAT